MKKLLFFGIFLSIGLTSLGQIEFDGGPLGTGTDWGTAENWSPDGVPTITDEVVIDGYNVIIPTSFDAEVASVSILSGSLDMQGTATLMVGEDPVKTEKANQNDQDQTATDSDSKKYESNKSKN